MRTTLGRSSLSVLAALAIALTLDACGDGTHSSAAGKTSLTQVTVGIAPLANAAALVLGVDKGFFKADGLNVKFQTLQVTSTLVAGVASGAINFGLGTIPPGIFEANEEGLGLQIVAPAGAISSNDGGDMVLPKSGIRNARGLDGKTVAVPAIGSFREMAFRQWMLENGGNPNSVTFVAVPPGSVISAIQSGSVSAGFVQQPFFPIAVKDGLLKIGNDENTIGPFGTAYLGWFGSSKYVSAHKSVVEAFAKAVAESDAYANKHLAQARAVLPSFAGVTKAQAKTTYIAPYPTTFSRSAIEKMAQLSLKFGYIKRAVNIQQLFWSGVKLAP